MKIKNIFLSLALIAGISSPVLANIKLETEQQTKKQIAWKVVKKGGRILLYLNEMLAGTLAVNLITRNDNRKENTIKINMNIDELSKQITFPDSNTGLKQNFNKKIDGLKESITKLSDEDPKFLVFCGFLAMAHGAYGIADETIIALGKTIYNKYKAKKQA